MKTKQEIIDDIIRVEGDYVNDHAFEYAGSMRDMPSDSSTAGLKIGW